MAAHLVAVLNVVVHQREVVQNFKPGRGRHSLRSFTANRLARHQTEQGAQSLTRGQRHRLETGIDPAHVVVHHAVVRGGGSILPGQHRAHLAFQDR